MALMQSVQAVRAFASMHCRAAHDRRGMGPACAMWTRNVAVNVHVMIGILLQEGEQGWSSAETAYQNYFLADNDSVLVDAHV